jgi:hypothetical protein
VQSEMTSTLTFLAASDSSYLILISARSDPQWTFGLTIAAVPIAALVLLIAAFAARQESDILMGISEFALIAGLTYFAYKLTRIYTPDSQAAYRFVRLSLTFISAFAIVSIQPSPTFLFHEAD